MVLSVEERRHERGDRLDPGHTTRRKRRFPRHLTNVNGMLYFIASDGSSGYELWRTDGTSAGTVLVRDICPGPSGASPRYLTNVNGTLYFQASDGSSGYELWKSDGTSLGTVMARDILPGASGASPRYLTNVNGTLYFAASDGATALELWSTDGTSAGTIRGGDINPGPGSSNPSNLLNVNGTLYFAANNGSGYELWKLRTTPFDVKGGTINVTGELKTTLSRSHSVAQMTTRSPSTA